MAKAYNVLPTSFIMQSLGYEGEEGSSDATDQPTLAVSSYVCVCVCVCVCVRAHCGGR